MDAQLSAMADLGTIETKLKNDLTWLQKHERLILVFMILLAAGWGWNRWINHAADQDRVGVAVSAQQLKDLKDANAQINTSVQQTASQYQQIVATLADQNAKLAAAVTSRNNALINQQATNNTAPLPEVAGRWKVLTGIADSDIAATPTGIAVTDTGARQTVNQLERVPVLVDDLKDVQATADNRQKEIDKANGLIGGLNTQVAGLNTQVTKTENDCKKQIDTINSINRKDKKNWFLRGLAIGASVAAYLLK